MAFSISRGDLFHWILFRWLYSSSEVFWDEQRIIIWIFPFSFLYSLLDSSIFIASNEPAFSSSCRMLGGEWFVSFRLIYGHVEWDGILTNCVLHVLIHNSHWDLAHCKWNKTLFVFGSEVNFSFILPTGHCIIIFITF